MASPIGNKEPRLRILIVGAGIAGLSAAISCAAAGHTVQVLEPAAKEEAKVGAGIHLTPNSTRILQKWDIGSDFWSNATEPGTLTVHRYNGAVLAKEGEFGLNVRAKYDAPYLDTFSSNILKSLYARATEVGVEIFLGERVETLDVGPTFAKVETVSKKTFDADLIVAADGMRSTCRQAYLGKDDVPLPTGDMEYRVCLHIDEIRDPELRSMVTHSDFHFWMGNGAHVMGYTLQNGQMYNLAMVCADDMEPQSFFEPASIDEIKTRFKGWDPLILRFLNHVQFVNKWKLMHHPDMSTWINEHSNLIFIGDACHAVLPDIAQGANLAIEDGAVLGLLLGKFKTKWQLPHALKKFKELRKPRREAVARESFNQRRDSHLPDGADQKARDKILLSPSGKRLPGPVPYRWICPEVQPWLYGYDAFHEVESAVYTDPIYHVTGGVPTSPMRPKNTRKVSQSLEHPTNAKPQGRTGLFRTVANCFRRGN